MALALPVGQMARCFHHPLSIAFPLCAVLLLLPATARPQPGAPADVGAAADDSGLVTITLRDSQLLRGHILAETAEHIILRLVSGGEMVVAQADIRSIKRDDESVYVSATHEVYKHDPNRTRYLFSPSAFMLRQGEGYFSQTELVASTLGYGVTDWLNIQIGSVLPALIAGGENFIVGARIGVPLSEQLHVAAGVHTLLLPGEGGIGIASGQLTLGTPRAHATISAGYPFAFDEYSEQVGDLLITVSGSARLSKHLALVTENWVLPDERNTVIGSFATRFLGEHSAVDVGLVFGEDFEVPFPWLDFTWNWD